MITIFVTKILEADDYILDYIQSNKHGVDIIPQICATAFHQNNKMYFYYCFNL